MSFAVFYVAVGHILGAKWVDVENTTPYRPLGCVLDEVAETFSGYHILKF